MVALVANVNGGKGMKIRQDVRQDPLVVELLDRLRQKSELAELAEPVEPVIDYITLASQPDLLHATPSDYE